MARYINPVPQYLDGNGDPIVNGKLTFYKSGTNSPLITYADSDETIPNTNPVDVGADGRVPNIFYSGLARVVCTYDDLETGETGKQLFDKDPVGGQNSLGSFESWDSQVVYNINDIVQGSDGNFYLSLTNENQGNDPTSTPTLWEEIRFISVWNTNVLYSSGEISQTDNGNLWKSQQQQSGNDPSLDDGSNWLPAVDSDLLLVPTNTVVSLTGGGTLTALRINELQDGSTYDLPLANTVSAGQYLIVTQPLQYVSNQPTVQVSGADTITIATGTDTDILFDQSVSKDIRLTSDGVSVWRLTV